MSQIADRVDAENAARPDAPTTHPEFDRLVRTMWRLRQPDGCPWDREQTHRSITKNMVEEAYEAVEAIEADDADHLIEELGDVLEQVVLHAQIAADDGAFTIDDVVHGLNEKLVRRHPHVFGGQSAKDADEVLGIWQKVKELEHKKRAVGGLFDGIPPQLSALRYALDIAKKADSETLAEARKRVSEKSSPDLELGQKIFDCVKEAADKKIEPEGALRDYIAEIKKAYEQSSQK